MYCTWPCALFTTCLRDTLFYFHRRISSYCYQVEQRMWTSTDFAPSSALVTVMVVQLISLTDSSGKKAQLVQDAFLYLLIGAQDYRQNRNPVNESFSLSNRQAACLSVYLLVFPSVCQSICQPVRKIVLKSVRETVDQSLERGFKGTPLSLKLRLTEK